MSAPVAILDKLRNYEYEKCGCGAMVGDIYALIHHIAAPEEEVDDLKEAAVPRTVEGDGSDLPAGAVVLDKIGGAWRRCRSEGWVSTGGGHYGSLPESGGPYTIIYTPKENNHD